MDGANPLAHETESDRLVRATGKQVDDLPSDGRLAWLVDPFVKNIAEADRLQGGSRWSRASIVVTTRRPAASGG
jgi:hypothetical protein